MRKLLEIILLWFFKAALAVRYRIKVKGLEKITPDKLKHKGGTLILPNHPAIMVDPIIVVMSIWKKFRPRPIIVEYMYYTPFVNLLMRFVRGLPIPNFSESSNSIKKRRSEKALGDLIEALKAGENILIYPAGKTKQSGFEEIGGASGLYRILQEVDDVNVVLMRTTGLWGSSFSRAYTGQPAKMFSMLFQGMKHALKNLIFFTPKRDVTVEFEVPGEDFPFKGEKMELNRYLEEWYNRPFETAEGEPVKLVPYSRWSTKLPKIYFNSRRDLQEQHDVSDVSESIQQAIIKEVAKLADIPVDEVSSELGLSTDLGLDSLDIAELSGFLHEQYGVAGVSSDELKTVGKLMVLASGSGEKKATVLVEEGLEAPAAWIKKRKRKVGIPEGETVPEVFLNSCALDSNSPACADDRSGILTYKQLKMRAILLASYIRKLDGDSIGVMLPASVAANIVILACQIAGKTPVMINWTVGPRHLKSVVEVSGITQVLSAWSFVDKLENVEFGPLDEMTIMLEDLRRDLSIFNKINAVITARKCTSSILKKFKINKRKGSNNAVILFTSGTEAAPKGVPLTHQNLLTNMRGGIKVLDLKNTDKVISILPPFHSFGFSVTGVMPILAGVPVACFPDPTEGAAIAAAVKKWQITIFPGAPTFLKGVLQNAEAHHLRSIRMLVSGAEKAPPELFRRMKIVAERADFLEGYGITECSPILTFTPPGKNPIGVGQPVPGVELKIIHQETLEELPTGERGLIVCRGENVFHGYLNPGIKEPFVEIEGAQWYNTGDLGMLDEGGNLILAGRLKRFVKIGGEMISLVAVEEALLQAAPELNWQLREEGPSLAICAKEDGKTLLTLFCTFDVKVRHVNKALKTAGFSNLVRVSDVQIIEEIPVMGTGKINYRHLEREFLA